MDPHADPDWRAERRVVEEDAALAYWSTRTLTDTAYDAQRRGDVVQLEGAAGERHQGLVVTVGDDYLRLGGNPTLDARLDTGYWLLRRGHTSAAGDASRSGRGGRLRALLADHRQVVGGGPLTLLLTGNRPVEGRLQAVAADHLYLHTPDVDAFVPLEQLVGLLHPDRDTVPLR